jgi:nucleotide-binding universal stress UspA family protein
MQKILCPTDLSAQSNVGTAYAISLARRNQAEIVFVHAIAYPVEPLFPCYESYELNRVFAKPPVSRLGIDELLERTESRLGSFVQSHFSRDLDGLRWKTRVSLGNPVKEIVFIAKQEKADLIVVTKRRRIPLGALFSSSISQKLSRLAPCPVLSVCPDQVVFVRLGSVLEIGRGIAAS